MKKIEITSRNVCLNELDIKISSAATADIDGNWCGEDVISPFSRLYYINSGSGVLAVNGRKYLLEPGNVYLIPVGLCFSHFAEGKMQKAYFHFEIRRSDGYDLLRSFGRIGTLERGTEYTNDIYRRIGSLDMTDGFILKSMVMRDVSEMIGTYGLDETEQTVYSDMVAEAMKIITGAPSIKISCADIARELFVSESLLSKKFKAETGISVGEYVDKMVFYGVQKDLIETDNALQEISAHYGFCDRFYFTRRFKQLFGETPVEYRKRLKIYKG